MAGDLEKMEELVRMLMNVKKQLKREDYVLLSVSTLQVDTNV